jgi:hypothetical protein
MLRFPRLFIDYDTLRLFSFRLLIDYDMFPFALSAFSYFFVIAQQLLHVDYSLNTAFCTI